MAFSASLVVFLTCFLSISTVSGGEPVGPDHARIEAANFGLMIEAPMTPELVVMNVRLVDSDNQLVFRERSRGEPVNLLALDLPDGEYTYEVVTVLDHSAGVEHGPFGTERSTRAHGRITVQGGEIIAGQLPNGVPFPLNADEASLLDASYAGAMALAGRLVDLVIPSAAAADLLAESNEPTVSFRDSGAGDFAWELVGHSTGQLGVFRLKDLIGANSHDVITVAGDDDLTSNFQSLAIDADGDIHWGNFAMNFDRDLRVLSIGTTIADPLGEVRINSDQPDIRFHDESGTQEALFQLSNNRIAFFGRPSDVSDWNRIVTMQADSPNSSLVIASNGNVGLGTPSILSSLHVQRDDGSAQILVDENNAAPAPRTLFRLENAGNTKFEITETSTGNEWAFTNSGSDFRISLQDSGVVEFRVLNNGNAVLDGALTQNSDRNAKQDIVDIDPQAVLKQVAALPISAWSYKDAPEARHIGPMAQDFHAAFGVGESATGISSIDTSGVALAAIQGLNRKLEKRNTELEDRNTQLEQRVAWLESVVQDLLPRNAQR